MLQNESSLQSVQYAEDDPSYAVWVPPQGMCQQNVCSACRYLRVQHNKLLAKYLGLLVYRYATDVCKIYQDSLSCSIFHSINANPAEGSCIAEIAFFMLL